MLNAACSLAVDQVSIEAPTECQSRGMQYDQFPRTVVCLVVVEYVSLRLPEKLYLENHGSLTCDCIDVDVE